MEFSTSASSTESFRLALDCLNRSTIPYVIGGAFALYRYCGMWRNTNDLDLYLERKHLSEATRVLEDEGFSDYGEMAAGDRDWIHHAVKDGTLIDLIWQAPNRLASVDESFHTNATVGEFLDVATRYMSPADLLWTKLFVLNRQRCDWPDIFQLIRFSPVEIDWENLANRVGKHWPVLLSLVVLFDWVYPGEAGVIPMNVRSDLLDRKREFSVPENGITQESVLDPWLYTRPLFP